MNRPSWLEKWKSSKKASPERLAVWGTVVILLTGVWFAYHSGYVRYSTSAPSTSHGKTQAHADQKAAPAARPQGVWATYRAAFESVQTKVAEIQHALEENQRLRYENDNLRLKLETARFDCREQSAQADTTQFGGAARTIASIGYHIPDNLLPGQLYTLGVTYFKAGEYQKAAVIFTQLTSMQDNLAFQTARDFLLTGVTWYELGNYNLANQNFDKALSQPETDQSIKAQAQARLWKGLVAKNQHDPAATQHWLRELVDHHPHSMEASWVNSMEAERVPASQQ